MAFALAEGAVEGVVDVRGSVDFGRRGEGAEAGEPVERVVAE